MGEIKCQGERSSEQVARCKEQVTKVKEQVALDKEQRARGKVLEKIANMKLWRGAEGARQKIRAC
jgi:hypothetical protein